MAETNKAHAGLLLGAGAAVAAAIALARSGTAQASTSGQPVSLDQPSMALLEAIAQANGAMLEVVSRLEMPGGNLAIGVVPNTDEISSGRWQVGAINTAYRLPELVIPDDMEIQLKGWPTNAGIIYVASSAPSALNITSVWPLLPNEAIGYRIKNLNVLYFSGTVAGDWIVWTVEHRR